MNYGIILENESSPLVPELCESLRGLGLIREAETSLTEDIISALNTYRLANKLLALDFCDPTTLSTLGIDAEGDEVILLARFGEAKSETELEIYDNCTEAVRESRRLNITVTEAISRRIPIGSLYGEPSSAAITAAVLALLNE